MKKFLLLLLVALSFPAFAFGALTYPLPAGSSPTGDTFKYGNPFDNFAVGESVIESGALAVWGLFPDGTSDWDLMCSYNDNIAVYSHVVGTNVFFDKYPCFQRPPSPGYSGTAPFVKGSSVAVQASVNPADVESGSDPRFFTDFTADLDHAVNTNSLLYVFSSFNGTQAVFQGYRMNYTGSFPDPPHSSLTGLWLPGVYDSSSSTYYLQIYNGSKTNSAPYVDSSGWSDWDKSCDATGFLYMDSGSWDSGSKSGYRFYDKYTCVAGVPDSDGDGVLDDVDQCADTPPETEIDAEGCPLVSDGVATVTAHMLTNSTPVASLIANVDPLLVAGIGIVVAFVGFRLVRKTLLGF